MTSTAGADDFSQLCRFAVQHLMRSMRARLKDVKFCYSQTDPLAVPRMQFYAVEIARNRKGLNDWVFEKTQAEKAGK